MHIAAGLRARPAAPLHAGGFLAVCSNRGLCDGGRVISSSGGGEVGEICFPFRYPRAAGPDADLGRAAHCGGQTDKAFQQLQLFLKLGQLGLLLVTSDRRLGQHVFGVREFLPRLAGAHGEGCSRHAAKKHPCSCPIIHRPDSDAGFTKIEKVSLFAWRPAHRRASTGPLVTLPRSRSGRGRRPPKSTSVAVP